MKVLILWLAKRFCPEILERTWVDQITLTPKFKAVQSLVDQVETTRSLGEHKHINVLTALKAEARQKGVVIKDRDIKFMIELAVQMRDRL